MSYERNIRFNYWVNRHPVLYWGSAILIGTVIGLVLGLVPTIVWFAR